MIFDGHKTIVLGHTECRIDRAIDTSDAIELLKAEKLLSQQMFGKWFDNSIKKKTTGAPHNLENYSISNSHSHGWVCVARNNSYEIGIDIQTISTKCERVKGKFISKYDVGKPAHLNNTQYYTLIWSLKEAAYKWHEEFIALKNIVVVKLEKGVASILLHSDLGALDCTAYFTINKEWILSVVEK